VALYLKTMSQSCWKGKKQQHGLVKAEQTVQTRIEKNKTKCG